MNQDTICAIATAPGGAIGIIRVSGPDAIAITGRLFTPASGKPLAKRPAYTLTFGQILSPAGEVVDEVLVSLFRAPHSYTGEDSVEISCHGSAYILQQVMQLLVGQGCRAAGPGEYTQRAFLNGKMDLSQAEAVADLIASTSAATHRMAMNQMRGGFSRELAQLRDQLLHLTSLMELELDFSDHEDLEFADRSELEAIAARVEQVIARLADTFSVGNALKNGVPVAIVGETNAGKSTLLNALVGEERAIVSDIHGTTRDVIEDTLNLGGTWAASPSASSTRPASARPPTPSRAWASSGASRNWSRRTSSCGSSTPPAPASNTASCVPTSCPDARASTSCWCSTRPTSCPRPTPLRLRSTTCPTTPSSCPSPPSRKTGWPTSKSGWWTSPPCRTCRKRT